MGTVNLGTVNLGLGGTGKKSSKPWVGKDFLYKMSKVKNK